MAGKNAKNILIIDDDNDDLNTMKTILEKNNYKVTAVTSGKKALDLVAMGNYDLVLLDIIMPSLTGYDLLRLMREKINHNIRLVYVSIVPKNEVNTDDSDGFIQKPFSPETLLEGVKKALETGAGKKE